MPSEASSCSFCPRIGSATVTRTTSRPSAARRSADPIPRGWRNVLEAIIVYIRDEIGRSAGLPREVGGIPLLMKTLLDHGFLYGDCMTVTGKTLAENVKAAGLRVVVFNPLPWTRSGTVEMNGETVFAKDVPPCGYRTLPLPPWISAPYFASIACATCEITGRLSFLS